jgi:hypothetical protein
LQKAKKKKKSSEELKNWKSLPLHLSLMYRRIYMMTEEGWWKTPLR